MIARDIRKVFESQQDDGIGLNDIADEFRQGRDVLEIIQLLDSDDPGLIWPGAWILKEIPACSYNAPEFTERLRALVFHENFDVRFSAFGALFPLLIPLDPETQTLMKEMMADPREDLRDAARRAISRWDYNDVVDGAR